MVTITATPVEEPTATTPGAQQHRFRILAGVDVAAPDAASVAGEGGRLLSAASLVMPATHQARPHYHEEMRIIVILAGHAATLLAPPVTPAETGPAWTAVEITGPGQCLVIPPGWVHQAVGLGRTDVSALEVSADPCFNRSVLCLDERDDPDLRAELRARFATGELGSGRFALNPED